MALITQVSDPALWEVLHTEWIDVGYPGFFQCGTKYYQHHQTTDGQDAFTQLDLVRDLVDSRSYKRSKPASYKKLDSI